MLILEKNKIKKGVDNRDLARRIKYKHNIEEEFWEIKNIWDSAIYISESKDRRPFELNYHFQWKKFSHFKSTSKFDTIIYHLRWLINDFF